MKTKTLLRKISARLDRALESYHRSVVAYRMTGADILLGALLSAFFLALYYYTCGHQVNVAGDSPELVAGSYSLGIVHPPGYPLYTMLGYIATRLPFGSIAFRANFMSSIFHALTIFFVYASLVKLTRNRAAALIAGSALGLSPLFWSYSLIAEVFSLNNLFISLFLFLSILAREKWVEGDDEGSRRILILLSFFCGLSLTNHLTAVLFFPTILLLSLGPIRASMKSPRFIFFSSLAFLAGLLPYIYLPLRASQKPLLNFGDPSSLRNFINVVTRRYYGTGRLWIGPQARHRLDLVFRFLDATGSEVRMAGILLCLIGAVHAARKKVADFMPLFTGLVFTGVLFPMTANVEVTNTFYLSTLERFFLLPLLVAIFFLGIGVDVVIGRAREFVRRIPARVELQRAVIWVLTLLLAFPFLFSASSTVSQVSLRYDPIGETYFRNLVNSAEDGSFVFLVGDISSEMSMYYEATLSQKKDMVFFIYPFMFNNWYLKNFAISHPGIKIPDFRDMPPEANVNDSTARTWFIDVLRQSNPDIPAFYINAMPPDIKESYQFVPCGTLYKIMDRDAELDLQTYYISQLEFWRQLDFQGMDTDFYPYSSRPPLLVRETASYASECGEFLYRKGEYMKAATFYRLGLHIAFSLDVCKKLAETYLKAGEPDKAIFYLSAFVSRASAYEPELWEAFIQLEDLVAERSGI